MWIPVVDIPIVRTFLQETSGYIENIDPGFDHFYLRSCSPLRSLGGPVHFYQVSRGIIRDIPCPSTTSDESHRPRTDRMSSGPNVFHISG